MNSLISPIELGAVLRLPDYKFLQSYLPCNVYGNETPSETLIQVKEAIGSFVTRQYLTDLNSVNIKNCIIGPSTYAGSKNITLNRAARVHPNNTSLIQLSSALGINMAENDSIIMARQPSGWYDGIDNTLMTPRTPIMKVRDHTNSLILNTDSNTFITLPSTEDGTISPKSVCRFTCYYRSSGNMTISPLVTYINKAGLGTVNDWYNPIVLTTIDTEESDFHLLDIRIPYGVCCGTIPDNVSRLSVTLLVYPTTGTAIFELVYPVIESSCGFLASATGSYMLLPDAPSDINYERNKSSVLGLSNRNTNISFDSSKLFPGHIGRDLFSVSLSYQMIDASYVQQLRNLEHLNLMGYPIALRPQHAHLPPVMIGNIKVEDSLAHYDYRKSNVNIIFEETE
jgi:hypothetical protein